MKRTWFWIAPVMAWMMAVVMVAAVGAHAAPQGNRWTIPPGGDAEKNPLPANAATIANGKKLFEGKCQRCHGPQGKGNGPDGDPDRADDMDLTKASAAKVNTDGVVFYKIFNGRATPKMPAQKDDLTKEQIWSIVAYVQTLRQK